jgi:[ribosomal protein S18]-alanine N-acetyltransferase
MAPALREFRPSDLGALYKLDQVCFAPGIAYSRAEIAGFIRRPGTKTWVAENKQAPEREIAGFVIAHCDRRRQGHIVTIDVAPHWRGQAVGTVLMNAAEDWMRCLGVEVVSLETAEDNLTAQSFYARRGYVKLRRIEHYYGTGAAAWLMAKPLRSGLLIRSSAPES